MKDGWPGTQKERGPDDLLPAMLGDEGAYLSSERCGRLVYLRLGQVGHAAKIDLIAPKEL